MLHGLYDTRYALHHRLSICKPTPRLKHIPDLRGNTQSLDLCLLNTTITGSTDTLGIALTSLPDPAACNYLLLSTEPPLTPEITSFSSASISSLPPTPPASSHPSFQHLPYSNQTYRKQRCGKHLVNTHAPPPFQNI